MKNKFLSKFPSIILMSILVLFITSCQDPMSPVVEDESIISGPGALTLDDETAVEFRVVMNKEVTCTVVADTSGYDQSNVIMPLIEIEGEIDTGKTAKISFRYLESTASGFTSDHRIAYWDSSQSVWQAVTSTLESYNLTISATVDHFSVWTVINTQEVEADPIEVDISGTVTIDMGADWTSAYWDDLAGKALSVLLLDSATQAPISGKMVYSLRDDWVEQTVNVYTVDYIITAVEAGSYLVAAIIDVDGDGEQEGDEPLMLYGGASPTETIVDDDTDINEIDFSITTVSVSGTVSLEPTFVSEYSGENIYLSILTPGENSTYESRYTLNDNPLNIGSSFPCIYSFEGLPTSYCIVMAFADMNGNGIFNIEEGEPYGIWNYSEEDPGIYAFEDLSPIDIELEPPEGGIPELTITSPAQDSTINSFTFTGSGTLSDNLDDVEDKYLDVYIFDASDIDTTIIPPEWTDSPKGAQLVQVEGDGTWTTASPFNLAAVGNGDYTIITLYEDSDGNTGYGWSNFTIDTGDFESEGSFYNNIELTLNIPYTGQVGAEGQSSYYEVSETSSQIDSGSAYIAYISGLSDDAHILVYDIFSSPSAPEYLYNGAYITADTHAVSMVAPDDWLYIEVDSFASFGTGYDIVVEQLTETITLEGIVTITEPLPAVGHSLIIHLIDENIVDYYPDNIAYIHTVTPPFSGTSPVDFSISGVRPGFFSILAFYDMNDDGHSTVGDYSGTLSETWYLEDTGAIGMNIELSSE